MTELSKHSSDDYLQGDPSSGFMVVCEHASNYIPPEYQALGLPENLLQSHIAWDPGAAEVTRRLHDKLGASALLGGASRLLYDCNRPVDAEDAIPARSEIFDIPGNQNLSNAGRQERVEKFYRPFHEALHWALDQHQKAPALVTIHSFTPIYHGKKRDVEIGILHDTDSRLADAMLQAAPGCTDLLVLENEPYGPGDGVMHTLKRHGIERGILNVMIEVRNDLLETESQCVEVADMLADMLKDAVAICDEVPSARRASL